MGVLLTTVTKQNPPTDPFLSGKFSSTTLVISDLSANEKKLVPLGDIPYPAYLCTVFIDGKIVGLFQSISDFEISRGVEPLEQGGLNEYAMELPGQISYGHVTLKSGFSTSTLFLDWMMAGKYDAYPIAKKIEVYHGRPSPDTGAIEMTRYWTFYNAMPVKWKITDFDVSDIEKIVIESVELSFDYFEVGKVT